MATDISNYQKSWQNNTTSYAVGSKLKIQVDFITPVTATGAIALVEIDNGKVVEAALASGNNTTILHFEYTITSADSLASTVSFVGIVGTVKKRSGTVLVVPETNIRNNGATSVYQRTSIKDADYGAEGDGVVDDTAAIQAALNSGAKEIIFPAGTYKCMATITKPNGVSIRGEGSGVVVLDFGAATLTDGKCLTNTGPTLTTIPDLSTNYGRDSTSLVLNTAPGLSPDDVFLIYHPTDSSWSAHRTDYRAGEFLRVATVSGSTVTLQGSLRDSYSAADVDLYHLSTHDSGSISGITVKGKGDNSASDSAIYITGLVDGSLEDVRATESSYGGIVLRQCYNVNVRNVFAGEDQEATLSTDYGLVIANSQDVTVVHSYLTASRHGITIGGFDSVGCVVNREVLVDNCFIKASGSSGAADIHGNSEYIHYNGCSIDGGASFGGNITRYTNNFFFGGQANGNVTILATELKGFDHSITGNHMVSSLEPSSSRGMFVDVAGATNAFSTSSAYGGVLEISDNKLRYTGGLTLTKPALMVKNKGFNGTGAISVVCSDNDFYSDSGYIGNLLEVDLVGGKRFNSIDVIGNTVRRGALVNVDESAGNNTGAVDNLNIDGNRVTEHKSATSTVAADNAVVALSFTGNHFSDCGFTCFLGGASSQDCQEIRATNNQFTNFAWGETSTAQRAMFNIRYCNNAFIDRNHGSTTYEALNVTDSSQFTEGGTITGGTSGATATVHRAASNVLFLKDSTSGGPFTSGGETITDDTTSNTSTNSGSEFVVASYSFYYSTSVDNSWEGGNIYCHDFATPSVRAPGNTGAVTNNRDTAALS